MIIHFEKNCWTQIGIIRWFSYHLIWHLLVDVLLNIEVKNQWPLWDNDLLLRVTLHPGFNFFQQNRVMSHEKIRKYWMMICFILFHHLSYLSLFTFICYCGECSLSSHFFHFTLFINSWNRIIFLCSFLCI